ncbi:hypothetical protein L596_029387 [Steinernema carpocapsae]|uniref:Uncharacterized protein n=1 Tax=Steinernema carpocapsae TaxID=34508 RepID=A0A4U5LUH3_STECR|nr:hypothetical protein L596_029387 [Steinernema carpocapsae]
MSSILLSGVYEGHIDKTGRAHDVDGEPLDHHVSVYHSGRSDEPTGKAPEHTKIKTHSSILLVTGLFKKSPAHLDYPSSGVYEGHIDKTGRAHYVDGEPLDHHVSVYHSGRSDEPTGKAPEQTKIKTHEQHPSVDLGETITEKAQDLKTRVTGLFKKSPAHLDYPSSGVYEGHIDRLEELMTSDEPTGKAPEQTKIKTHEQHPSVDLGETITEKAQDLKTRVTGLFKKSPAHLDYPSSGVYEGPIDETGRAHDVDGKPLDHHVSVYHSGRSDEPTGKAPEQTKIKTHEQHPSVDLGETITEKAQDLKTRVTGLFKKNPALTSTIPAPESTKDISIRLEELMTWMESLLTITSPSITLADPMSQLEKPLSIPKSRLMSSIFC